MSSSTVWLLTTKCGNISQWLTSCTQMHWLTGFWNSGLSYSLSNPEFNWNDSALWALWNPELITPWITYYLCQGCYVFTCIGLFVCLLVSNTFIIVTMPFVHTVKSYRRRWQLGPALWAYRVTLSTTFYTHTKINTHKYKCLLATLLK